MIWDIGCIGISIKSIGKYNKQTNRDGRYDLNANSLKVHIPILFKDNWANIILITVNGIYT